MENQKEQVQQPSKSGLGLGLGVDLNLNLSGVQGLVSSLNDALAQTGAVATDTLSTVIRSVRELGLDQIKQWAEQGGQQAKDLYHQLVGKLQQAADRGEEEARSLLQSAGEKVESGGQKMQDVASEESGTTH